MTTSFSFLDQPIDRLLPPDEGTSGPDCANIKLKCESGKRPISKTGVDKCAACGFTHSGGGGGGGGGGGEPCPTGFVRGTTGCIPEQEQKEKPAQCVDPCDGSYYPASVFQPGIFGGNVCPRKVPIDGCKPSSGRKDSGGTGGGNPAGKTTDPSGTELPEDLPKFSVDDLKKGILDDFYKNFGAWISSSPSSPAATGGIATVPFPVVQESGGGLNIKLLVILGIVAGLGYVGYRLWKKYRS